MTSQNSDAEAQEGSQSVHIISATGRDAELIVQLLQTHGVLAERWQDIPAFLQALHSQPLGPVLIAEEMLSESLTVGLASFTENQPSWSDMPILVLTSGGQDTRESLALQANRARLGNLVLLERPIRKATLLSSVRAALRARNRQFQIRDVLHDRDRALEDLRRERAILRVALDNLPVGLIVAKGDGGIVMGNSAVERIFGHPVRFSRNIEAYAEYVAFHPNGRRVRNDEFPLSRAISSGKAVPPEHFLYRRGDGRYAWITLTAAPIKDEKGAVTGGIVAVSDIDEQTRSADNLRLSEDRFRRLIENASVGVSISDFQGNVSYMNPLLLTTLGYTDNDLSEGRVRTAQLTPPESADLEAKTQEGLRETGMTAPLRRIYRAKDGREIPFLVGAVVLTSHRAGDAVEEIASFFTDLSSQQRAEIALIQSEKLAAVGRLAASISHEINNPLEAVTNLLYLLGEEDLSTTASDYLRLAEKELARVSQIAGQTLRFHRQATGPRAVTAEELLDSVIGLYSGRLHNSGIHLEMDLRSNEAVTCYEGDIRQVLNNLVGNAVDAMRTGGRLLVRASRTRHWSTGRAGIRISVADNGHGMPAATVRRIFEAFYTTKGINGTGLGLWISSEIVGKHAGALQVRSSTHLNRSGTVFSLFLPAQPADLVRQNGD